MLLRQHAFFLFLTHAWSIVGFPSEFCAYSLCRLCWKSDQIEIGGQLLFFGGGVVTSWTSMGCAALRAGGRVEAGKDAWGSRGLKTIHAVPEWHHQLYLNVISKIMRMNFVMANVPNSEMELDLSQQFTCLSLLLV